MAVPAAALVPYLVYRKRWRDLILLPWLPAGAALAVALPWSLAIHWREDTFWDYFFWNEHIRRFLSPTAQHVEPMWYFVPVLLVGFLPWTALAPALAPAVRRLSRQSGAFAFLVC